MIEAHHSNKTTELRPGVLIETTPGALVELLPSVTIEMIEAPGGDPPIVEGSSLRCSEVGWHEFRATEGDGSITHVEVMCRAEVEK